jgi:hypothetical protein
MVCETYEQFTELSKGKDDFDMTVTTRLLLELFDRKVDFAILKKIEDNYLIKIFE